MTDRIHSITLILEKDMRDDDAEFLINLTRNLKGVLEAVPNVSDFTMATVTYRINEEWVKELYKLMAKMRGN